MGWHHGTADPACLRPAAQMLVIVFPNALPVPSGWWAILPTGRIERPPKHRSSHNLNQDPLHEYLSTWPRKNLLRLVPFSRMISARSMKRSSHLINSAPPSPQVMFLVSWKLWAAKAAEGAQPAASGNLPNNPWALSSTTAKAVLRMAISTRSHPSRIPRRHNARGPRAWCAM